MSTPTPHEHHADDARADDGPPTDAFTDDVRQESAEAGAEGPDHDGDED
ncbi:hypothetical protein [Microbacterium sp. RU33B]|nr:hypothetical protein [Microbacterium sp. RU33B]SIT67491.1 hypothetical protein SAMN05880545_0175 [Microbacterium sp. RU33B]